MLGLEGLSADHGLPDVPLGSLPDLDTQLVRPGVQVPLQPDISSVRDPGFWLMHIILLLSTYLDILFRLLKIFIFFLWVLLQKYIDGQEAIFGVKYSCKNCITSKHISIIFLFSMYYL